MVSSFTNVGCNGASNGTINITASGGTTPYGYVWSNGSTIQNQTGLAAGTYTVTVTDANGCTKTLSQTVTQPSTLDVIISNFTNVGCNGASNGTINITASGGTTPYGYVWSNGSTIQNQTGLAAGTYTVTVTDANGCTKTASQILTQPSTFDVIISNFTNVGCNGASNGTINITASGGTTPYGYVWSNGSTIQNQTGLAAGTYTVTVTDANGCTQTVVSNSDTTIHIGCDNK
ncbi:MAG: SprB repeat-containing protein [Bacteroidetes bacterium]|nr:SprB repeat-containing protein [Bacteroidota bacterium]